MADGKVRFIPETIDKAVFRSMCTLNAAKIENLDALAPELNPDGEVVGAKKTEEPKPEDKKPAEEKKPEDKKPADQPAKGVNLKEQLVGVWVRQENTGQELVFEFIQGGKFRTHSGGRLYLEGTYKFTGEDEIEVAGTQPGVKESNPRRFKLSIQGDALTVKYLDGSKPDAHFKRFQVTGNIGDQPAQGGKARRRVEVLVDEPNFRAIRRLRQLGQKARFIGEVSGWKGDGLVVIRGAEPIQGDEPAVPATQLAKDYATDAQAADVKYKKGKSGPAIIVEGVLAGWGNNSVILDGGNAEEKKPADQPAQPGGVKDRLIGKWAGEEAGVKLQLEFTRDGKMKIGRPGGPTVVDASFTIVSENELATTGKGPDGKEATEKVKFTLNGDDLAVADTTGKVVKFKRMK
jgi:hypothetical protein